MSAAHGIPAAPRGEEQPDVERLKGLDDGQFWSCCALTKSSIR